MLPKYDVVMDENNDLERIVINVSLFRPKKNYYMLVTTPFAKYKFKLKMLGFNLFLQSKLLWESFDLEEVTIYKNGKTIYWDGSSGIRKVIPEGERIPILDPKIASIISAKWPIWINVDRVWITPEFKDVPSFLFRELMSYKFDKGSSNRVFLPYSFQISFEEIYNPVAINREVL